MNRSERRKLKAVNNSPVYNITGEQLKNMQLQLDDKLEEVKTEAIMESFIMMISIPLKILKEKYQVEDDVLQDVANSIVDEYEEFSNGKVSIEEYKKISYDTCGILLKKTGR